MKKFAIALQLVFVALIFFVSSQTASAAKSNPVDIIVVDFLHQYIDHATPADMPNDSRIAAAVLAAKDLAEDIGSDLDLTALSRAALDPLIFAPASDTTFTWNGSAWVPDTRTTYTYSNGKKGTVLTETWSGSAWVNSSMLIYTYNGSGYILSYRSQTWSGSAWVDEYRYTNTYSGALVSETLAEQWTGTAWENLTKSLMTYDGSSRLETTTTQMWSDPDWVDAARQTLTYDGNGDLVTYLSELWTGASWLNQIRINSVYDGSHRETSSITQNWNFIGSNWVDQYKSEYEYDGASNLTLERSSTWSSVWAVTDVDTFKYNGSNQNIQNVHWRVSPSQLTRDDFTYDGSGNLIESISYLFSGATWLPTDRTVVVYISVAVKVDDAPLPDSFVLLQNHPNPFNPATTIRYSLARPQFIRIEVFNILGQLVRTLEDSFQGVGTYETTWDGADTGGRDVASGVYFYRLRAGEFVQTRKMVLSR